MIPSRKIIENALQSNEWDFGNEILYKLCRENFEHDENDKIIAKVWLIGRAYAAAIERRRNKTDINDDFYINKVAPIFRNSEINKCLATLKNEKEITVYNIEKILKVHFYLMTE